MKFLIFGTGDYYGRYRKWFDKEDILALLDNSPEKQNKMTDGIRVLPPEEGVKLPFDAVVILSFYVKAMKKQLLELGVPEEKIYHFYDLHRLGGIRKRRMPVRYYGDAKATVMSEAEDGKKLLLMSQDMELGGATLALLHAAEVLVKNHYKIVFASMIDGPLRRKLLSEHISVVVDENLQTATMEETGWVGGFSLVLCNTINFHVFLSERDNKIPVIWWLHDAPFFYDGIDGDALRRLDRSNMKICSVGPVAGNAIKKLVPDLEVDELLYGTDDTTGGAKKPGSVRNEEVCFVTVGDIGPVKGQDVLVAAVRMLPGPLRRKTNFYLVGRDTSLMARQLREEVREIPEVVMTGMVEREEVDDILCMADVLVCPSREDSMPTVAAEAMMHHIPCIISDTAGTAGYIQDGVDGFIFRSGDAGNLSEKIKWCIENREKLHGMGKRSRKIYDTYFSAGVFEKNILNLVNNRLFCN